MNDEDIKIIEGLLRHSESTLLDEESLAIENLLKENEELKTMLKNRIKYTNELEQDLFENASNYVVPVAKIKERIKEFAKEFVETEKIEEELIFYILEGK